jgi:hypothetical protein
MPSLHFSNDNYDVIGDVVSQLREQDRRTRGRENFMIVDKRKPPR